MSLYPTEYKDLEATCQVYFGTSFHIQRIVASEVPTGTSSRSTVFETTKGDTYALCMADAPLTLGEVKQLIRGMGMKAETFLPPFNKPDYFAQYGRDAFLAAFPGRRLTSDDDISFYMSLAPYSPALVKVAQVERELRQYVPIVNRWHKFVDYSYNRIKVQQ